MKTLKMKSCTKTTFEKLANSKFTYINDCPFERKIMFFGFTIASAFYKIDGSLFLFAAVWPFYSKRGNKQ